MKTKYLYYAGAAALAYYLYSKSKSTASAANLPTPAAKQMSGALGAYSTGNPMMEALGTLGCSSTPGIKGG